MDPKACLQTALLRYRFGDYEEASEHLNNYRQWRARGGFEPEVDTDAGPLPGDAFANLIADYLKPHM